MTTPHRYWADSPSECRFGKDTQYLCGVVIHAMMVVEEELSSYAHGQSGILQLLEALLGPCLIAALRDHLDNNAHELGGTRLRRKADVEVVFRRMSQPAIDRLSRIRVRL